MKTAPDGAYLVTVVGEDELPHGLFAPDGSTRVTTDQGLGSSAPNGALRIGSSGPYAYTPDGAWNGTLVGTSFYPVYMTAPVSQDVRYNIFDQEVMTISGSNEPGVPLSLGVVFFSTTKGTVRSVSFWKTAADIATSRDVGIYNTSGDLLATGTSSGEASGPGWVSVDLDEPLVTESIDLLVAAVHFPQGAYGAVATSLTNPIRSPLLVAESNAGAGGNGRYSYGPPLQYPSTTGSGTNFGIDVDFYPIAFPTSSTTGVPTGTILTPMSGGVNLWSGGLTTLEDRDIDGHILVQAQNVIIRRCRIRNTDAGVAGVIRIDTGMTDGAGLLIEDCEIDGTTVTVNGIAGEGTFLRNKIINVDNGINLYGPSIIKDNYIRVSQGTIDAHFDGIENNGASTVTVKHNTVLTDNVQTASVMLNNQFNGLANIDVIDNHLSGGAYTVYVDNTKSASVVDSTTIRIWYNKMGEGDFGYFALYTSGVVPLYNYDAVTSEPV